MISIEVRILWRDRIKNLIKLFYLGIIRGRLFDIINFGFLPYDRYVRLGVDFGYQPDMYVVFMQIKKQQFCNVTFSPKGFDSLCKMSKRVIVKYTRNCDWEEVDEIVQKDKAARGIENTK